MALTKTEASARSRAFVDADQELSAWLASKLAEIDVASAEEHFTDEETAASRLLIYKDLGRRAKRTLAQIVREHK
ncbi:MULTISPECIES: hypothetical protein [unclassified Microbacterium]|uniref:hypothetical protein n=1 Tax=unclassified Microbacterium TaxID=2609290 RepID=UPI000C2B8270|nr:MULTISPECIES: hypothetical protein [unclassified Microbacterium]